MKFECFFVELTFWKISRKGSKLAIATNSGVPSSSTPYTMFGATVSLVTASAEDLRLFRVERVRLLLEKGHFFSDKLKVSEFKNNLDMLNWIG